MNSTEPENRNDVISHCSRCNKATINGDKKFKFTSDGSQGVFSCDATFCPSFHDFRPQFFMISENEAELLGYKPEESDRK